MESLRFGPNIREGHVIIRNDGEFYQINNLFRQPAAGTVVIYLASFGQVTSVLGSRGDAYHFEGMGARRVDPKDAIDVGSGVLMNKYGPNQLGSVRRLLNGFCTADNGLEVFVSPEVAKVVSAQGSDAILSDPCGVRSGL
jgi:hypothetical protein